MQNTQIGWIKKISPLFVITVLLPTFLAILYFGLFASDVYISESRFVVRSPDKPAASGLGILLKSTGFSNGSDEIFAAQDFLISRDALRILNRNGDVTKSYGGRGVSFFDRFDAIGMAGSFEDLYKYYRDRVRVEHDSTSSITILTVRAYNPRDAQSFNERLLTMAEATVNRLNDRGRNDLIKSADFEVGEAKRKARDAAIALSNYRNREGVIDPEKQATVQLQLVSKLQDELIATQNLLHQIEVLTPRNPQIDVLRSKVKNLSQDIDQQVGKVAGDQKSLSSRAAQYQRLILESQFSDKQLAGAMAALQDAKSEAERKQAYVERIVQPNLPDDALEPRRLRGVFATLALGLVAWGVFTLLLAGIREHHD